MTLTLSDIPALRLYFQFLTRTTRPSEPSALVSAMGALQAQDADMAHWAIGVRLPTSTKATVEASLASGSLVRTHVMRPTWHILAGDDVRWMQALTGKYIKAAFASHSRTHGLNAALYARANDAIAKTLEGGNHHTRNELMQALNRQGIETDSSRAVLFMMNAETDALVCNGTPRGKDQTYALLDEKVPQKVEWSSREEALSVLAERYFTSHAPATLQDFHWWSGLPMPEARLALKSIAEKLQQCELEGKTYWMPKTIEMKELLANKTGKKQENNTLFLLPAFDEYCVSYKDRRAVFEPRFQSEVITKNGIFKPMIVANGCVIGVWKRTVRKNTVIVEPRFFEPKSSLSAVEMAEALAAVGQFQELSVVYALPT